MHVRLPELQFWGRNCWDSARRAVLRLTGTANNLLPKPMDKHDPLVTVVRYSGPRGCAVLMHTTFSLTRKRLSKFTGMHQAGLDTDTESSPKVTRESYHLDPVVLVKC